MKTIKRQALLPFSTKQMFDLVDDIEKYPEFLPNCVGSTVLNRTDNQVTASLAVSKGGFERAFTTRNKNNPYQTIEMELVEGPFKHLNGCWTFTKLDDNACKVELVVSFEFSSRLTGLAFGSIFSHLAESFVDAFSERAKAVYR
ncbi:type II toxin-antitoxin system RatA family toxin [Kangiella sediminilitoris]